MENGKLETPEIVDAAPADAQPVGRFIGAEIHIVSDAVTGAIRVNAPPNSIVALGLMEVAKDILLDNQKEAAKKAPPRIIPAGADALANLRKS